MLAALERRGESAGDAGGLDHLRRLLTPFVLRRVKADVLQSLPPKTGAIVDVKLGAAQRALYLEVAGRSLDNDTPGDAARNKHLFTELRKAANHPLLLRSKFDAKAVERVAKHCHGNGAFGDAATLPMVRRELATYNDFDLHELCVDAPRLNDLVLDESALFDSAKCVELRRLLPQLKAGGHRVLLFSQWVRLLDLLGLLCDSLDLTYARLDGSTPIAERQALVNAFNAPDAPTDVFLLSTRAGGLGINLTGADAVVVHDVDFNPEIDRQAEDRAHRIGQTKPVTVYRLVAKDTVDGDILALAMRKRKVNERVMRDGDARADSDDPAAPDDASAVAAALKKALAQYRAAQEKAAAAS